MRNPREISCQLLYFMKPLPLTLSGREKKKKGKCQKESSPRNKSQKADSGSFSDLATMSC